MTKQEDFWSGDFGKQYTDRNSRTADEWDQFYQENWGITKIEMNEMFIGEFPRDIRILEVGCNTGMQLAGLRRMGFDNVWGVELQPYAVEEAKRFTEGVNLVCGSGFDLPFKDGFFDIVVTNGVLIHIAPKTLHDFMSEMVRCSRKYIWGFEYFADEVTQIDYRGHDDYLWKADYGQIFADSFGMREVQKKLFPYVNSENVDAMYLLEK